MVSHVARTNLECAENGGALDAALLPQIHSGLAPQSKFNLWRHRPVRCKLVGVLLYFFIKSIALSASLNR